MPLSAHLDKATPQVRKIYQAVVRALRACGPFQAVPTKSGINLLSRTSLGGVTLHRTHVNLGLLLTRRLDDARVVRVLQISPQSFVHRVRVSSAAEVDAQLRGWIREAYQAGLMAGRRPR